MQRTLKVKDPAVDIPNPGGAGIVQTNAATIETYLRDICPEGSLAVDPASGAVSMTSSFCSSAPLPADFVGPPAPSASTSSTPAGCSCLCDFVASKNTWTIVVDDAGWPQTVFDDHNAANGTTLGGTGGTVTAPSTNSPKLWGAATTSGSTLDIPSWLVLGHELCGHAWLGDHGAHAPDNKDWRGAGGHQETIKRENQLRAEHGIDARGTYKDPQCGESYWRDKATAGPEQWSSFRKVCKAWRTYYNFRHGTKYTINDRIP